MAKHFTAAQFTATQFDTAETKAKFANALADFLLAGCPGSKFTKFLYHHLNLHFNGHIAHYNRQGFYAFWFAEQEHRERFIQRMLEDPCHGHPAHTFCDVEKAMQKWYAENKPQVDEALLRRMQAEQDAERAETRRLAALRGQKTQSFRVVAKSENQGSFGHWGYIVLAEDGSTFELYRSCSYSQHEVGDTIEAVLRDGKPVWQPAYEIAYRKPNASAEIIAKVWEERESTA